MFYFTGSFFGDHRFIIFFYHTHHFYLQGVRTNFYKNLSTDVKRSLTEIIDYICVCSYKDPFLHFVLTLVFTARMSDLFTSEVKERRRTVVVYKSAASEGPGDGRKEKLSSYKNLMYSTREAELIEDACRYLIEKSPTYAIL